ncbi:cobalamin biosynthesis protein [Shewanella sp. MMG014]|uniref:cobalamin biosynthesis protein CobD/CbiB n=1 Tax=Shewanella sp. MMG014 TaxID=2822691 RepID=UPI001B3924C2|nr:cobalamin biosynthesis protein [Shewanella sp. MMG014]MBQ4888666.1 cobalamin biosynthesis protein [Shewanella sp. MMG014]
MFDSIITDNTFYEQLLRSDGNLLKSCLVLFMALLISRVAPLSRHLHPIVWFHQFALLLSKKVNHPQRSAQQQLIAGIMATTLLVIPIWFIIYFILSLAAYPWFFDFLVLYFCISDAGFKPVAKDVISALEHGQKGLAKTYLSPWLMQNTASLSEMGICKATIERLLISPSYGTVATILFYALGGTPLVLLLHLFKQLEHCWPNYVPQYRYFGAAVYWINRIAFAVPQWLWNLTLVLQGGLSNLGAMFKKSKNIQGVYGASSLYLGAKILQIELGGPQKMTIENAEYRVSITKINPSRVPTIADVRNAISLTTWAVTFWLSFTIAIPILWTALRWVQSM